MFTSAEEVLQFIQDEDVQFVDVRFCDLPGVMQHFNVPAKSLNADFFVELGSPGGASKVGLTENDPQVVKDLPPKEED